MALCILCLHLYFNDTCTLGPTKAFSHVKYICALQFERHFVLYVCILDGTCMSVVTKVKLGFSILAYLIHIMCVKWHDVLIECFYWHELNRGSHSGIFFVYLYLNFQPSVIRQHRKEKAK